MTRSTQKMFVRMQTFNRMTILPSLRRRYGTASNEMDRGDVPGWVMITLMTAVIVVLIWGIASAQLTDLLNSAFGKVSKQGG